MKTYSVELKHYDIYNGGGCSVYINGQNKRKFSASGCGYDRNGAALGNWATSEFQEGLKELFAEEIKAKEQGQYLMSKKYYGAVITDNQGVYLDGACGTSCIERILEAIGCKIQFVRTRSKNSNYYLITK